MSDLSADLAQRKQKLRERLRFRRQHFAANLDGMAQLAAFRSIPAPLVDILAPYQMIGAYAAWGDEPDILPMLQQGSPIALPHHASRFEMMGFRAWDGDTPLVKGPWTTRQPADDSPSARPDLILCPLVGFDRRGGRIGQGGGHYDRYFAAHSDVPRIGIAWSVQEVDRVPTESTDMMLDAVLTEQEFILCGDRL